jgi:hypothetical protein
MDVLGSPATYGTALATAIAMRWLGGSDDAGARGAVSRAEGWWPDRKPRNLVEASAWLWAWPGDPPATARAGWEVSWAMIEQGQGKGGGWGPYADAPPEPFDTALALLVLMESARHGATVKVEVLARGRRYLMETQREDGSWEETTRPARGRSYAQRMSTTAWAALALLELE